MEHKYLVTLVVPLILLFVGALAKKIVRRSGGWRVSDAFLGVEAGAAAMTGALTYILDVLKILLDKMEENAPPEITRPIAVNLGTTGIFIVFAFALFLFLLSTHQDWENVEEPSDEIPWWRKWSWHRKRFWLGGVSNLVGFGLLVSFLLLIKTIT